MAGTQPDWTDLNQQYLLQALAEIRSALLRHAGESPEPAGQEVPNGSKGEDQTHAALPALERLTQTFGLSAFERSVLLLCAGMELDSSFGSLCARAQNDASRPYPTFSLALAALPSPHWSAITPASPLRRWRFIESHSQPSVPVTVSALRIDERVLDFLVGVHHLDERLQPMLEPAPLDDLAPSHRDLAKHIAAAWLNQGSSRNPQPLPVIQLCGTDESTKQSIAAAACAELGMSLFTLAVENVPGNAAELEGFLRLWEREAALTSSALCLMAESADRSDLKTMSHVSQLLERLRGPALLIVRDRWRPLRRATRTFDVSKPSAREQMEIWREQLGVSVPLNGTVNELVAQFNLNASSIRSSVQEALCAGNESADLAERLWEAGRAQARPRLEDLAQRIVPMAEWDDLVLPEAEKLMLREISSQVAHRATVYHDWGFAGVSNRGLGISALFAGASGTGKTMAAEVLAGALRLDLYRIDLSSVVNKYIGETEKNLRRVFDAAEDGGAILFFDEADALFGKRSEVKDSHDRYANIEINYLLQRMESYRGLSILATNMKTALDPAFLRRIRFVINFPFPDASLRAAIWERVFPTPTPVENLDIAQLAKLNVAGGNIRNIAMNAAFLAANAGEPVRMPHLWRAACTEYAKMERPLTEVEAGAWR